jgi:23S rRNA pseudouridine2605 synthase
MENRRPSRTEDAANSGTDTAETRQKSNGTPREVRLNKAISDTGGVSRRKADELIASGVVTVNGKKVFELGTKVDPTKDKIFVDGKPLKRSKGGSVFAMLHKPRGYLTTMEDPLGRPTIADLIGSQPVRLFPVGRLDWDSEGLILLTNDGDYANKIMHPKAEVTKTYLVKVNGQPKPQQIQKLLSGVPIIGGRVKARHVSRVQRGKEQYAWLKIIITEGKNRQIRLMFEKIGFDVLKLQRIAIGRLRLGTLDRGELVFLNDVAAELVFKTAPELEVEKTQMKSRQKSRAEFKRKKNSVKKPQKLSRKTDQFTRAD